MSANKSNTALLVMDMQNGIVGMVPNNGPFISRVVKAIAAARSKNIPVIYVVVGFRQGMPEVSPNNKSFAARKTTMTDAEVSAFSIIHPDVSPAQNEIVVTKRRISAFTGSDLEVVLRSQGIQHIVLTGIATSGVVLSTTREAADKDYSITILSDCCYDADEEVHRVLTTKIFPRQAEVVTLAEWSNV